MEKERAEKMDAVANAIREGLKDLPGRAPSDLELDIYAACVIDRIENFGFKIVKASDV